MKRWKFCLLAKQKEPLCVPVLLTLKFALRAAWFVISNTRLQHWRALHTQLVLVFWISYSALGYKTPLLTYYGFGVFHDTEENFFLWTFMLQWVFYCDFTDMFVLLCTRELVFVQMSGYWWHKSSCWKPSSLSFQQDKPLWLCEIFLLQDW